MVTVAVIVFCAVLLVLAFVAPRLSRGPERGGKGILGIGRRGAGKAPGSLGKLLAKPFSKSQRAVGKSGSLGRRAREKAPF